MTPDVKNESFASGVSVIVFVIGDTKKECRNKGSLLPVFTQ